MNAMNEKFILECCVDSVESAVNAQEGGANRLELCSNLIIGGTSPGVALFRQVKRNTDIRVHVLLRPRFGDFLYTEHEFSILLEEARMFREEGADGVVIGCLTADGRLDVPRMRALTEAAGGMSVTLHRAFDVCADPFETLRQAKELKVDTVLTSGQADTCLSGLKLLKELCREAGENLKIMAGAGVDAGVIRTLLAECPQMLSFHMSGKKILKSAMTYRKSGVNMGLPSLSEFEVFRTDKEQVAAARKVLEEACPAV